MTGKADKKKRCRFSWPVAWALVWPVFALLALSITGFRVVTTSEIAGMLETTDVPMFAFFEDFLPLLATLLVICSLLCLVASFLLYPKLSSSWRGLGLCLSMAICGLLSGLDAVMALSNPLFETTKPTSFLDWLRVLAFPVAGGFFLTLTTERSRETDKRTKPDAPWFYLAVFLLGVFSVFIYGAWDHLIFWSPDLNGGYNYEPFFEGETKSANAVLYGTSLLFASIIGLTAAGCRASFRITCLRETGRMSRMGPIQGRQAFAAAGLWAILLTWPWMFKIWPEIQSEGNWLLPVGATGFCFAILAGPIGLTNRLLTRDENERGKETTTPCSDSEPLFLTATLFLFYPFLRLIPFKTPNRRRAWLLFSGAAASGAFTWLAHEIEAIFSFEDWRGMLKQSQLPALRIFCSTLLAFATYLLWKRYLYWRETKATEGGEEKTVAFRRECQWGRRVGLLFFVLVSAGGSWPFWGWSNISENTFARTAEFSDRHRFELLALHWLFDGDGDGYASVLHGADHDNDDPYVLAGGMARVEPCFVKMDAFSAGESNASKPEKFPNVVLLYLEGVTPTAITAYGKRSLRGGKESTPHIDQLAREGALFTNARVVYPSTWDSWYATISGRMLRIMEMTARWKFSNRYSGFNNLNKVLRLGGIERWCHPDAGGYAKLFLLENERNLNWQPEFDASLTAKEKDAEITIGDKRLDRMLSFIDDITEGQRFFLSEHMGDTHFPWLRTSGERAKELGFDEGLEFAEEGGQSDRQKRYYQTIARMDGQIGQLITRLKERRFYDDTCIIIVGDHGCQWYEHERGYYVSHLYDPSIRIPMVIKLPQGRGVRSLKIDAPVIPQDILPTICEMGDIKHLENETLGELFGHSLLPLLHDKESPKDEEERRNRDLLLITHYDKLGLIYQSRWKLIFDRPTGTIRLFDLVNDPFEMKNLADSEKGLRKLLMKRLRDMARNEKDHRAFLGGFRILREEKGPLSEP